MKNESKQSTKVVQAIGMAWYTKENYAKCMAIFSDSSELHDTYEDWIAFANPQFEALTSRGINVVRVNIDPYELASYCREAGFKHIDTTARQQFCAELRHFERKHL